MVSFFRQAPDGNLGDFNWSNPKFQCLHDTSQYRHIPRTCHWQRSSPFGGGHRPSDLNVDLSISRAPIVQSCALVMCKRCIASCTQASWLEWIPGQPQKDAGTCWDPSCVTEKLLKWMFAMLSYASFNIFAALAWTCYPLRTCWNTAKLGTESSCLCNLLFNESSLSSASCGVCATR